MKRVQDTLYDIIDTHTGENFNYSKVTTFADGSAMDDTKADGIIYRKLNGEYFKRNFTGAMRSEWFNFAENIDLTPLIYKAFIICSKLNIEFAFGQGTFLFLTDLGIPGNLTITGKGNLTVIKAINNTGNSFNIFESNVTIKNLTLTGQHEDLTQTLGGFRVTGGAENINFDNVNFININQAVWLYTCEKINVLNCYFSGVTYGIIQQIGYSSSYVTVNNCVCENSKADFIEGNCEFNHPSEFWIVTNNKFLGSNNFPIEATENRFIGLTFVSNVVISNNAIKNSSGDGAIHLEGGCSKVVISNNVLENCVGSHAYIYLLSSLSDCVINSNIFIHSNEELPLETVLDLSAAVYTNKVVFSNNLIKGSSIKNLNGINASSKQGISIFGNIFENCNKGVILSSTSDFIINSNQFLNCINGIDGKDRSGNSVRGVISSNQFKGISEKALILTNNTNGTAPNAFINVTNNLSDADLEIRDGVSNTFSNNVALSPATICNADVIYYGGGSNNQNNNNRVIA